jgi:hypothetical protein
MKKFLKLEYKRRVANAKRTGCKIYREQNTDLYTVPDYRGNFSKSLPHGPSDDVDKAEFEKFLLAVCKANPKYIDSIKLGTPTGLKLTSLRDIFDIDLFGKYLAGIPIALPWTISSGRAAAEMAELYAMALARDVSFTDYETSPLIHELCNALSLLQDAPFPKIDGQVTPQTIFRGPWLGCVDGPYVSQFFLQTFRYGLVDMIQRFNCAQPNVDYLTTVPDYLSCHNGKVPKPALPAEIEKKHLCSLRACTSWIQVDEPCQAILDAACFLLNKSYKFNQGNPYVNGTVTNQTNFANLGRVDLFDMISRASKIVINAAWWHKYTLLVLRPEEFGFLVHESKIGQPKVSINAQLLSSSILDLVYNKYGTYLLPQAYNSGCPTHPSYPSGHAVLAGALGTIVKAWFDCNQTIKLFSVSADGQSLIDTGAETTIGNELNKLISNVAIFRNAAGIHYAQDAYNGNLFGEKIAIELLKEFVHRYDLHVTFEFRSLEGHEVHISNLR